MSEFSHSNKCFIIHPLALACTINNNSTNGIEVIVDQVQAAVEAMESDDKMLAVEVDTETAGACSPS